MKHGSPSRRVCRVHLATKIRGGTYTADTGTNTTLLIADLSGPGDYRFRFFKIAKKQWEHHKEAALSYADIMASIDQYYDENIAHRDQTDKLVEASMSSLDRSSTTINDPVTNQKLNEATETFARISSKLTEVLSLVYVFDFSVLLSTMKDLQAHALKQEESSAAWTKSSTNMAWNLGFKKTALHLSDCS
ncbi:hypothetical protein Tco_1132140 [Tanacetum coccineum]|uniref:Uncharacterized protein n=1 Tax=Tanacetum coccineum TaxID=301880 RepID=A0ABQ5JB46_9ASTR